MSTTSIEEMLSLLDAHPPADAQESKVATPRIEWEGFSQRLRMPVFAIWGDDCHFNRVRRTVTAFVLNRDDPSPAGLRDRERWLNHAEEKCAGVAAFFVLYAEGKDLSLYELSHVGSAVYVGKIVHNESSSFIIGEPTDVR